MNDLKKIMKEYAPNNDIFCEDDELMMKIKKAVDKLEDGDKIIFIMYCECGSMRDLGKQLGVSHTAIWKIITKIKKQILNDIGYIDD